MLSHWFYETLSSCDCLQSTLCMMMRSVDTTVSGLSGRMEALTFQTTLYILHRQ